MSQTIADKLIGADELLSFFSSRTNVMSEKSARAYNKALSAFRQYALTNGIDITGFSGNDVENWAACMLLGDMTVKTAAYYLDNVHALFNAAHKEGLIESVPPFKSVGERLRRLDPATTGPFVDGDTLSRFILHLKSHSYADAEQAAAADIVMISLLNRGMAPKDIAMLKKDDMGRLTPESAEIAGRNIDSRRAYIFPLRQSALTPAQLERLTGRLVTDLLQRHGIPCTGSATSTLRTLWACAAIRSGISPTLAVATLGSHPAGMPALSLCTMPDIPDYLADDITAHVNETLLDNPSRWYAMRLRPGVKFAQVSTRLDDMPARRRPNDIFYPCEEIARRIGKRIIFENRPLISDIAFMRSRATDLGHTMAAIGDLAWCYTVTGRPGSAYAPIPDAAMHEFQCAIGSFTPDYEVAPLGALEVRPGDRVIVIGGLFSGYEGLVETIEGHRTLTETEQTDREDAASATSSTTIYRVIFPDARGLEWRVSLDSRLLRPLP